MHNVANMQFIVMDLVYICTINSIVKPFKKIKIFLFFLYLNLFHIDCLELLQKHHWPLDSKWNPYWTDLLVNEKSAKGKWTAEWEPSPAPHKCGSCWEAFEKVGYSNSKGPDADKRQFCWSRSPNPWSPARYASFHKINLVLGVS